MRAVWLKEFGPPEVLVPADTPEPALSAGQVLIDVACAGVTFVETQVRAGRAPFPVDLPMIPGNGVGGRVVAVGSQRDRPLLGKRVVTTTGGSGGYAERVAVDAGGVMQVPEGVSLDTAVALLADGRTATMLMDVARVRPGERVLVEAAAGGVGNLLVQLARGSGAIVVALVGGARKARAVGHLGPAAVVDYRLPGWTEQVRAAAGEVDVVFDGVGGDVAHDAFGLLRPGGRMVSFGMASGTWAAVSESAAAERQVALLRLPRPAPEEMRAFTTTALRRSAAGELAPLIGQRFPLERAAEAHARIESRATIGKTLLEVSR